VVISLISGGAALYAKFYTRSPNSSLDNDGLQSTDDTEEAIKTIKPEQNKV
jgi:hypothetical protein